MLTEVPAGEEELAGTIAIADEDCWTGTIGDELWATGAVVAG